MDQRKKMARATGNVEDAVWNIYRRKVVRIYNTLIAISERK